MKKRQVADAELRRACDSAYWREDEARLVVDACAASGLTVKEFARRNGVVYQRLQRWMGRFKVESQPTFHPVRLTADLMPPADPGKNIELIVQGGRRIAVGVGFDASLLEELVRVVESWRC